MKLFALKLSTFFPEQNLQKLSSVTEQSEILLTNQNRVTTY